MSTHCSQDEHDQCRCMIDALLHAGAEIVIAQKTWRATSQSMQLLTHKPSTAIVYIDAGFEETIRHLRKRSSNGG